MDQVQATDTSVRLIKFPSISQFRDVISHVRRTYRITGHDANGNVTYDNSIVMPTLQFEGTVKLHGTNAAIVCHGENVWYQSRERVLTPEADNAAFAAHMSVIGDDQMGTFIHSAAILGCDTGEHPILIFGEWCGSGIQSSVAISELPKMFVVFKVKVNDIWFTGDQIRKLVFPRDHRIFCIYDFPTYEVEIDMETPTLVQNTLGEITTAVELECPVGKHFGVTGVGEGIVWSCITYGYRSSQYWFKVKGEKHSASKVRVLAAVDVERIKSKDALIDLMVTENRLLQGIQVLKEAGKEVSIKSTGDFLRWVFNDCVKEELDTIMASGFEPKELGAPISARAKPWYFQYLDAQV